MDIDKFVEKKAVGDSEHDSCFKKALLASYNKYKDKGIGELDAELDRAREWNKIQHGTHQSIADCLIIYELLTEKLEA